MRARARRLHFRAKGRNRPRSTFAARASDIDVVYLTGYGFPAWRGGPMFYADQVGLDRVRRRVREFASQSPGDPEAWKTAPLLERLADAGGRFNG